MLHTKTHLKMFLTQHKNLAKFCWLKAQTRNTLNKVLIYKSLNTEEH